MANVNLNEQSSKTQCDMIANWLRMGYSITSLEALKMFGCLRLSSRIWDLRERGMNIQKKTIVLPNKKRVCEYLRDGAPTRIGVLKNYGNKDL